MQNGSENTRALHKVGRRLDESEGVPPYLQAAQIASTYLPALKELNDKITRLENQLFEEHQKFKRAFDHSGIGMAIVGLDGRWLEVNDSLCRIVGYSREELLRLKWQDITVSEDIQRDQDAVNGLIERADKTEYRMIKTYIKKDKSRVRIILSVVLIEDSEGTPVYFVSQIQSEEDLRGLYNEPESS